MDTPDSQASLGLTRATIALVVIQIFRLLFGGYLVGLDQFHYNDLESAFTVFMIYGIIGLLTALLLLGKKRVALGGLIVLSIVLLLMESVYMAVYFSQAIPNPSLHDPTAIWWATVANYIFPLLTLVLAIEEFRG